MSKIIFFNYKLFSMKFLLAIFLMFIVSSSYSKEELVGVGSLNESSKEIKIIDLKNKNLAPKSKKVEKKTKAYDFGPLPNGYSLESARNIPANFNYEGQQINDNGLTDKDYSEMGSDQNSRMKFNGASKPQRLYDAWKNFKN